MPVQRCIRKVEQIEQAQVEQRKKSQGLEEDLDFKSCFASYGKALQAAGRAVANACASCQGMAVEESRVVAPLWQLRTQLNIRPRKRSLSPGRKPGHCRPGRSCSNQLLQAGEVPSISSPLTFSDAWASCQGMAVEESRTVAPFFAAEIAANSTAVKVVLRPRQDAKAL
jgi:hypothetical protein